MSGRRGLVWDGETVAVGDGVVKSKKIKQDLRKHKSTTAYESILIQTNRSLFTCGENPRQLQGK